MEVSMHTQSITSTWQAIIKHFFPVFTSPTAKIFAALAAGWVLCTARRTVTGMIRFAELFVYRPHDAFHRFFSGAQWSIAELWRLLTILLVKKFYPRAVIHLDLDDTLFHHPGKKVNGASNWRDPVRSISNIVYAHGLNLIVLTLRVYPPWGGEPIGLPVNMRLRRKDGPTHINLAQSMLVEIASWLPQRSFICHCDGFYTALIDREMPRIQVITRMRKDAIIFELPPKNEKPRRGRKRVRGALLPKPLQLAASIKNFKLVNTIERGKKRKRLVWTKQVIWYHVSKKPVMLVISRDPAQKEKDDFFVTTYLALTPQQVVGGYAGRWSIEDTFKNTKQLLGGQQPQSFKRQGPQRAAAMSFWLYSIVWLWYLRDRRLWKKLPRLPWYRQKRAPSFADALACLRQQLWKERINCMFDSHIAFEKIPKSVITALSYAA
jgi:hypothetical protein